MTAEELLEKTFLIDYAVSDAINEFEGDDEVETDPYHFVDRIDAWLAKNQFDYTYDAEDLAQKWLEDEGYELIKERIHYLG